MGTFPYDITTQLAADNDLSMIDRSLLYPVIAARSTTIPVDDRPAPDTCEADPYWGFYNNTLDDPTICHPHDVTVELSGGLMEPIRVKPPPGMSLCSEEGIAPYPVSRLQTAEAGLYWSWVIAGFAHSLASEVSGQFPVAYLNCSYGHARFLQDEDGFVLDEAGRPSFDVAYEWLGDRASGEPTFDGLQTLYDYTVTPESNAAFVARIKTETESAFGAGGYSLDSDWHALDGEFSRDEVDGDRVNGSFTSTMPVPDDILAAWPDDDGFYRHIVFVYFAVDNWKRVTGPWGEIRQRFPGRESLDMTGDRTFATLGFPPDGFDKDKYARFGATLAPSGILLRAQKSTPPGLVNIFAHWSPETPGEARTSLPGTSAVLFEWLGSRGATVLDGNNWALKRTDDHGATWESVGVLPFDKNYLTDTKVAQSSGTLYCAALHKTSKAVASARSPNGGVNWEGPVAVGTAPEATGITLLLDDVAGGNAQRIAAGTSGWKSTNGGDDWSPLPAGVFG